MAELPPFRSAFSDVDASGAGNQLIDYVDAARRAPAIVDAKTWSFEVLDLEPGMRTLDVGCGTGEDVMVMAEQVQPNGRAVGIDLSATMIEEATRRHWSSPRGQISDRRCSCTAVRERDLRRVPMRAHAPARR